MSCLTLEQTAPVLPLHQKYRHRYMAQAQVTSGASRRPLTPLPGALRPSAARHFTTNDYRESLPQSRGILGRVDQSLLTGQPSSSDRDTTFANMNDMLHSGRFSRRSDASQPLFRAPDSQSPRGSRDQQLQQPQQSDQSQQPQQQLTSPPPTDVQSSLPSSRALHDPLSPRRLPAPPPIDPSDTSSIQPCSTPLLPPTPVVFLPTQSQGIISQLGNTADSVATLSCFLCFEPRAVVASARKFIDGRSSVLPLFPSSTPDDKFKGWVHSVLSTTQVTDNVIMLGLLFIHRFKCIAHEVYQPKPGSATRFLAVALMLGNKYLDDNTYTNKTWADVTGVDVKALHKMEVEFLSNMRYDLLVMAHDWQQWVKDLKAMWNYCQRASRNCQLSPIRTLSPRLRVSRPSPAHSPTSCYSSQGRMLGSNPPYVSKLSFPRQPDVDSNVSRKRSIDGEAFEPLPKRVALQSSQAILNRNNGPSITSCNPPISHAPTSHALSPSSSIRTGTGSLGPRQLSSQDLFITQPSCTPSSSGQPHERPCATAAGTFCCLPPVARLASLHPINTTMALNTPVAVAAPTQYPSQRSGYNTPIMPTSPTIVLPYTYASSPAIDAFTTEVHTPNSQISPCAYTFHASPYRPVHPANILLNPLTSLQSSVLTPSRLHYQPLGRPDEIRTGIVPEYRSSQNASRRPPVVSPSEALLARRSLRS